MSDTMNSVKVLDAVTVATEGAETNPGKKKFCSWQYWVAGTVRPTAISLALWGKLHEDAPYVQIGDVETAPVDNNSGVVAGGAANASGVQNDGLMLGAATSPLYKAKLVLASITGGTAPTVSAVLAFHD